MRREVFLLVMDGLIRTGFAIWAIFCVRYIVVSLKRGHVYINGQIASRVAEPLGFWLGLVATLGVVLISGYVVLHGL